MGDCQFTISESFSLSGVTLHKGDFSHLKVKPAKENTGIVFWRTDVDGSKPIKVLLNNVINAERRTMISNGELVINTIEHFLAALYSQGIDNVICELSSDELPIFDGSALPFIDAIHSVGKKKLKAIKPVVSVKVPFSYSQGESKAEVSPCEEFKVTCSVQYENSQISNQCYTYTLSPKSFCEEIAPARTFCTYKELEYLFDHQLSLGGSLDNANILDGEKIYCKGRMRYENELVRHKILDVIGDFSLLNAQLKAHITCHKPGHSFNNVLIKKILENS